jgi:hypothetical protein
MKDNNHDSIKSILNATMLVKDLDAPETLRKMVRRDLERDKVLLEEFLRLDEDFDPFTDRNHELTQYFRGVSQTINLWLSDDVEDEAEDV